MAKKTTRAKRPTRKRSVVEYSMLEQKRALERGRRHQRQIAALGRDIRRAMAKAKSELYSLARTVFDSDADFRQVIVGLSTTPATPPPAAGRYTCICGHYEIDHHGDGGKCTLCVCEMFETEDARAAV